MENNTEKPKLKGRQKSPNHGGKREGAGRKSGTKNMISVTGLMDAVADKSGGKTYNDLLVQDFLEARNRNDTQLMLKYHQLILQKVLVNVSKIEITEDQNAVEAKRIAFAEALAKLTDMGKE
jgi:hypothetical protein